MPLFDLPLYLDLAVLPIADSWPRPLLPIEKQQRSRFSATATTTYRMLQTELDAVGATERVLRVPVAELAFRRDGRPRADAKLEGSAMMLEFEDPRGEVQRYPADAYLAWQENLRAIALTLQALRAVDRYGVTSHGEQYRGFLALESGAPSAVAADEEWLRRYTMAQTAPLADVLARAKRNAHPDLGGTAEEFARVMSAEQRLRDAGLL